MNGVLLLVAIVAAVNPFRARGSVPESASGRARPVPLIVGGALLILSVAGLAWWSGPLLDALQITPETFKIAAGFVAVLTAGYAFVAAVPAAEPELAGWRAGIWPVWYPRLLAPEVMFLAVTAGSGNGVMATAAASAAAAAALGALGPVRGAVPRRAVVWAGRLFAALLVLAGIWLTVDGIRDV
jgi:small neutral amino acid transporter SnatA (MarC family)